MYFKRYQKYFNQSTEDIPLLKLLYIMSIPVARIFVLFRVKPNHITTLSNFSVLISLYSILALDTYGYFLFFWMLGLILDICDGIVARETNQKSAQGSFYDHFTDQVKILLLFLAVGIYYQNDTIWILSFLSSTFFLLFAYLNMLLKFRRKIIMYHVSDAGKNIQKPKWKRGALSTFKKYTYNNLFLMQGNFIVFLGLIFLEGYTIGMLALILLIISVSLVRAILAMIGVNNQLKQLNLPWH